MRSGCLRVAGHKGGMRHNSKFLLLEFVDRATFFRTESGVLHWFMICVIIKQLNSNNDCRGGGW